MDPTGYEFPDGANGMPEAVDWLGQKAQVDFAVENQHAVKHIVLVSSMGTAQGAIPVDGHENFLDEMGGGGLLRFKHQAEIHLQQARIPFTIIHAGGLSASTRDQRWLVGYDDSLLGQFGFMGCYTPRLHLAEACVHSLTDENASNHSFDMVADPKGPKGPEGKRKGIQAEAFSSALSQLAKSKLDAVMDGIKLGNLGLKKGSRL